MITNLLLRFADKARRTVGMQKSAMGMMETWLPAGPARERLRAEAPEGELATIFFENPDRVIHKWLHYFPIYETYLAKYRGSDFKMLEIGVFRGGSIAMWRKYFGDAATIFGIDINPDCKAYVEAPNQVRIGSQADPRFLQQVVDEMGRPDVILDDGSHIAKHQRVSFEELFPALADGGLYIIEDVHTAYWPWHYDGGFRRAGTAIEFPKKLIDDMHHWYHGRPLSTSLGDQIAGVHFHDSVVIIEKKRIPHPVHTQTGASASDQLIV